MKPSRRAIPAIVLLAILLTGCSMLAGKPDIAAKGPGTVAILYQSSEFKDAVVEKVKAGLEKEGFTVILDTTRKARFYHAKEFGAVVYMADYWAWHTPRHAVRYNRHNGKAANIVFVVTAGDPDVTIAKPFDAITSASKKDKIDPVAEKILARIKAAR